MKYFLMSISIMCLLSSCSFNVSMAHTEGTADDVIDDTSYNVPDISPSVRVPFIPGSEIEVLT